MFSEKNISFWKTAAVIFLFLTFVNSLMGIVSFFDRRRLNALVESRQRIGLVQIRASERANLYTNEDKAQICTAWNDAGYNAKGEECPK